MELKENAEGTILGGISCSDNGQRKMTWVNLYRYFEIGISFWASRNVSPLGR